MYVLIKKIFFLIFAFALLCSCAAVNVTTSSVKEKGIKEAQSAGKLMKKHNIEIDYDLTYSGNTNNFASSYKFSSAFDTNFHIFTEKSIKCTFLSGFLPLQGTPTGENNRFL